MVGSINRNNTSVELRGDREIVMSRRFAAPRELVFAVMTEARHLAHWSGPYGFTVAHCEVDARPGGAWRIVQQGPDGAEHRFKGVYQEVVPPERFAFTQIYDVPPHDQHAMLVSVTLAEDGDGTLMTSVSRLPDAQGRDLVLSMGMTEGATQTYQRLAEYLATLG